MLRSAATLTVINSYIVWYEQVTVGRPQVSEKDQQVRDTKVYPAEVRRPDMYNIPPLAVLIFFVLVMHTCRRVNALPRIAVV